jgi:hypothetical protein
MTSSRIISPDARSALLVATGTVLLLAPFMLGFGVAAVASGVIIGVLIVGLGLAGTAFTGRATIPAVAHTAFDQGIAAGLILAAALFAVFGEFGATALFFGAGLVELIAGTLTHYGVNPGSAPHPTS